jgi:hypothetical protein
MKFFATLFTLVLAIFLVPTTGLRGRGGNNRTGVIGALLHNRTNFTNCINGTGIPRNRTATGKLLNKTKGFWT